jgi:hypothetical protein
MTYTEHQKFSQPWVWIGLTASGLITTGLFGIGIYKQIIMGQKFGNHPMSDTGLIITSILIVLLLGSIALMFGIATLETVIDDRGIAYRFFPFHLKFHRISWEVIEKYEVIAYHPVRDYGGWGIRGNKNNKAYNVSGNVGLHLYLKDGTTILLGTQNQAELSDFIATLRISGK